MSLLIKSGIGAARVVMLQSCMWGVAAIVDQVYEENGIKECWITAGIDGQHQDGSLHYVGYAIDVRTNNVPTGELDPIRAEIKRRLGDDFDVVKEGDHFHIEAQPHKAYTGVTT